MQSYARVVDTRAPLYTKRVFDLGFRRVGYHRLMLPFCVDVPDRVDLVALALRPASRDIRKVADWRKWVRHWQESPSVKRL